MAAKLETRDSPSMSGNNESTLGNVTEYYNDTTAITTAGIVLSTEEELASRVIYVTFLLIGLIGNIVLLIAVTKSQRQQGMLMNIYIIHLGVANVLHCVGHLPLFLSSMSQRGWGYYNHPEVCNFDGVIVYATSIITVFILAWMTVSNSLVMKGSLGGRCPAVTSLRTRIAIAYAWVHGLALSVPLMVPSFASGKYLCHVCRDTPTIYALIILLVGFGLPMLLIIVLNVDLACTVIQERKYSVQVYEPEKTIRGSEQILIEVHTSKYITLIFLLWCLFQAPFLAMTFVLALRGANTGDSYRVEAVLTWFFVSYPIILPVVTFCWKKEVWHRLKKCLACQQEQFIESAHQSPEHRSFERLSSHSSTITTVPVLFATDHGLHIRTVSRPSKLDELAAQSNQPEKGTLENQLGSANENNDSTQCDVFGSFYSRRFTASECNDTSDYDSCGDVEYGSTASDAVYGEQRCCAHKNVCGSNRCCCTMQKRAIENNENFIGRHVANGSDAKESCECVIEQMRDGHTAEQSYSCQHKQQNQQQQIMYAGNESAIMSCGCVCSQHKATSLPPLRNASLQQPLSTGEHPSPAVVTMSPVRTKDRSAHPGHGSRLASSGSHSKLNHNKKHKDKKVGKPNSVGIIKEANSKWYINPSANISRHHDVARSESQNHSTKTTKKPTSVTPESYNMVTLPVTILKQPGDSSTPTLVKTDKCSTEVNFLPVINDKKLHENKQSVIQLNDTGRNSSVKPLRSNTKRESASATHATLEQRRSPQSPQKVVRVSGLLQLPAQPEHDVVISPPSIEVSTSNATSKPSMLVKVDCLSNSIDVEESHTNSGDLCDIETTNDLRVPVDREVMKTTTLVKVHSNEMRTNKVGSVGKASPVMLRSEVIQSELLLDSHNPLDLSSKFEPNSTDVRSLASYDKRTVSIVRDDVTMKQMEKDCALSSQITDVQ